MKQREDGRWVKTVTIKGKRKMFYSRAKTEKLAERDINRQMTAYQEQEEKGKNFDEVADEWSDEHYKTVEYNTQKYYNAALKQIQEHFSKTPIKNISSIDIVTFIDAVCSQGYALKTVKSRLLVLNLIFKHAVVKGYIETNPCVYISVPKNLKKTRRVAPEQDALQTVIKSVDVAFGFFAYLILYTGLRRGEALALRYSDIDYENKQITVNKSIYHKNNVPYEKTPKTSAGIRKVILLDNLIPILKKRASESETDLIFANSNGGWLTNGQFQSLWENYVQQTGLQITPHQLRHAYATFLFEAGVDEKDAQELMGHTTIQLTRDIYTHISRNRKQQTANKLNSFLLNCSQGVVK